MRIDTDLAYTSATLVSLRCHTGPMGRRIVELARFVGRGRYCRLFSVRHGFDS